MLLYVAELMLDLLFINERQNKTGMADVAKFLKDRQLQPLDKRVAAKMNAIGAVSQT